MNLHRDSILALLEVIRIHVTNSEDKYREVAISFSAYNKDSQADYQNASEALGILALDVRPLTNELWDQASAKERLMTQIAAFINKRCETLSEISGKKSVAVSSNVTLLTMNGRTKKELRIVFLDSDAGHGPEFSQLLRSQSGEFIVLKTTKGFHAMKTKMVTPSDFMSLYITLSNACTVLDQAHLNMSLGFDSAHLRVASDEKEDITFVTKIVGLPNKKREPTFVPSNEIPY